MNAQNDYGPILSCQACGNEATRPVLFVGYLPPVNRMLPISEVPDQEPWFPAEMLYCPECHLAQLGFAADPKVIFPPEYPYTSGTTRILRENFADLYSEVCERIGIEKNDLIVDVGSNDGTLLSNFHAGGHRVLGIEPSLTAKLAEEKGIPSLMTFFDEESVGKALEQYGSPKVLIATNVFAHIPDVARLMNNVETMVGNEGVFISESHYLLDLIDTLQYDTIYHEHLRYYSVTSLKNILEARGFHIFHVRRIPTHGGSIRVYASKSGQYAVEPSVGEILQLEEEAGLNGDRWIADFRSRVVRSKLALYEILNNLKKEGARIYGIGAPSRASTLVNYVGLDDDNIECVLELPNSKKLNKYMPGTKIPVLDEAKLYKDQPPYVLLLSWHIADELIRNLKKNGYEGDFIVPLPDPHIIRSGDVA